VETEDNEAEASAGVDVVKDVGETEDNEAEGAVVDVVKDVWETEDNEAEGDFLERKRGLVFVFVILL
jgi:hypothetical protein